MLYIFNKKTLSYNKINDKGIIILIFIVVVVSTITALITIRKLNNIMFISEETKAIILEEQNEFSEEKLKAYILELNLKFPHIVFAQAKLESGNFKSNIFIQNNNFFGMKCAKQRPSTNKGEKKGHAYFNSWRDCVVDYAFYQAKYLSKIKSESDYIEYLNENYAQDKDYINKLKDIIDNK